MPGWHPRPRRPELWKLGVPGTPTWVVIVALQWLAAGRPGGMIPGVVGANLLNKGPRTQLVARDVLESKLTLYYSLPMVMSAPSWPAPIWVGAGKRSALNTAPKRRA